MKFFFFDLFISIIVIDDNISFVIENFDDYYILRFFGINVNEYLRIIVIFINNIIRE